MNESVKIGRNILAWNIPKDEQEAFFNQWMTDAHTKYEKLNDMFSYFARAELESTPEYQELQHVMQVGPLIREGCQKLIAIRKSLPDKFVVNRWEPHARAVAQQINEAVSKPFHVPRLIRTSVDVLAELVNERLIKISALLPDERRVKLWENQSSRDWITNLREAIR
jgi:hypothetical protein